MLAADGFWSADAPESSDAQKGNPGTLSYFPFWMWQASLSLFSLSPIMTEPLFHRAYRHPEERYFPEFSAARCGHVTKFWPMDHDGD